MNLIHLISGGDVGGAKTHVLSLLNGLRRSHTVTLVCFMEGPFAQEARELGIATVVMPGWNIPSICRHLVHRVRKENIDLVHCHGARANLVGCLMRRTLRVPVITTLHSDPELDYYGRPLSNLTFGTANRLALARMDGWVCVSPQLRDKMAEAGRDPARILTIHNGVDFSHIHAPVPRAQFWQENGLNVPPGGVVFGIAARISPVKNIEALIRAFAQVVEKAPDSRLAIAGDGDQRRPLEQLTRQLCPPGSYRFLGWLRDTDSFYGAIDVNMLTSLSEGLPYAIAEGARMACATISTRVGAVPSIVIDGETGLLVEPGDVDGLAEKMYRLAQDGQLRRQLGQGIFEKVRREYSVETTVNTQQQIYATILRRYHRQGRDGVLICGAYGKGNTGDEAILTAILQQMRSLDPDMPVCVMSKNPRRTTMLSNVRSIYTFSNRKFRREAAKAKLFISGGGSLIQDATSTRSLLFYLYTIAKAHKAGCKVMMYGCGVGPVSRRINRRLAARVINRCVNLITLRDPDSARELAGMGVDKPEIQLTADPALLQTVTPDCQEKYAAFQAAAGLQPEGKYCLFALRPWATARRRLGDFAAAAEYGFRQYGLTPVFLLLDPHKDREFTQAVADQLRCPKLVLPPVDNGGMVCALMQQMRMVVSMRLHALIFAASQGTPVVAVSYDPKVAGFMSYMGQDNCLDLADTTAEALCRCMDAAAAGQAAGDPALHRMRALAEENGRLAGRLLAED